MKLEEITKKVLKFTDIPEDMEIPEFLSDAGADCFVECHLDLEDPDGLTELDKWILDHFPELEEEDSFFIHINY